LQLRLTTLYKSYWKNVLSNNTEGVTKTSGETVIAPQISETPKKRSRMPIIAGILAILIVATVVVGTGSYMLSLVGQEPSGTPSNTPTEYRTYSKYGLSFEYPKDMSLSEQGFLESTAMDSSGMVLGTLEKSEYEMVLVGWLRSVVALDLESTLDGAFEGMAGEWGNIDRGQLVTSEKSGDTMLYQQYSATVEGKSIYGVYGVWYNDISDRLYQLNSASSEQDVFP
jgi:hypothetical protein